MTGPEQHDLCLVSLLYRGRVWDLALPSAVPFAELQPMLIRLLSPEKANSPSRADGPVDDGSIPAPADRVDGVSELVRWQFSTIGGLPIRADETLRAAGVLDGDVVELRALTGPRPTQPNGSVRDLFEDIVTEQNRFWTAQTSETFVQWAVVILAAGLMVPLIRLPLGLGMVGLAGTVAVTLSVLSAVLVGRLAGGCASAALATSCGWAWTAGTSAFLTMASVPAQPAESMASVVTEWLGDSGSASGWPVLPAVALGAVAALLMAASSAHQLPAALVHTTALVAISGSLVVLTAAALIGAPVVDAGKAIAVSAVLAFGGLPRVALLAGGLAGSNADDGPGALDVRFARSDRVLIGSIIGVSLVAAAAACSVAFAQDIHVQLFAGAVGLALLLRSRIFSQIPHVVGPRIAGVVVFAALWVAGYRDAAPPGTTLLLVVATGAITVAMVFACRARAESPIGRARMSRLLGITEQLLVVLMVVLAAGTSGLFGWIAGAVG